MAQLMSEVRGHSSFKEHWQQALFSNRLAHALLVVGPPGVGKVKILQGMAQDLLCPSGPPACGTCPSCHRVLSKTSEGMLWIEPEGAQVKIDQAREIRDYLSLQMLGRSRVVVMPEAHRLNTQAANALLKSIEEPPSGTFFLMSTSAIDLLPQTIRSRVQVLRVGPLSEGELSSIRDFPQWVLAAAQGRVDLAEVLSQDAGDGGLRDRAFSPWMELTKSGALEDFDWVGFGRERPEAESIVMIWRHLLRDVWLAKCGDERLLHRDHQQMIHSLTRLTLDDLEELWQALLGLELEIQGNVDRGLAFSSFWLKVEGAYR